MTSLEITVCGLTYPNPFLLASGPPGTNGQVLKRSFGLGWGGAVCKTLSLDASKIINPVPRYGKLTARTSPKEIIGFQNIELISDRPFDIWERELAEVKQEYPERILIASIMEEYSKGAWQEIVERTQATGVDALELNFSCPHGLPERKMGSAMGADPEIVREVTGWVREVSNIPIYAKLTPNVTDPTEPALAAMEGGADGLAAINTVLCVIGVNLETLRPLPTVEGYSTPGGYSGPAVRPIALRHVMEISRACPQAAVSGMGGIETANDAIQFLLLGASTVQICTGAMLKGYEIIDELVAGLSCFMDLHGFERVEQVVGKSLPYFDTHEGLVKRQREARAERASGAGQDDQWQGDIQRETEELTGE